MPSFRIAKPFGKINSIADASKQFVNYFYSIGKPAVKMKSKFIQAFLFACIGITAEVIFTGIKYNIVLPLIQNNNIDFNLDGTSYIWMIFIYGSIPFIFPMIYNRISNLHLIVRLLVYASICILVEFITGAMLDLITGECPWRYTSGWDIAGYARLDYFPLWMLFGLMIEWIWKKMLRLPTA